MSLKDQVIEKLESHIKALEKEAVAKKAEAEKKQAQAETEKAGAELKEQFSQAIRSLQADIDNARTKLNEIKDAGEDRMEEFNRQVREWLG